MQAGANPTTTPAAAAATKKSVFLPLKGKFKSAANTKVEEAKEKEWKQPLRRHINPNTQQVEFVTMLVRVLSGDAEHDFHARFPSGPLIARDVVLAIAEKERLNMDEAPLFSLWVIGKDIELQLRPDQDIFQIMVFWNRWVMKYTHFPEASNPQHHINRHWFVYKRAAAVTLREEREFCGEVGLNLLYGEAKRNLLTRKYVCTQLEASTIAGYQLQMAYGDYDASKSKAGYLTENDRLFQLLPMGLAEKMRPSQWEEIITVQYKTLGGLDVMQCREGFLDFVRNMPCYGCSFFPVCAELPPSGFFEFRTQNWLLGIGPNGVCIVDCDIQKYVYILAWSDVSFKTGPDQVTVIQKKNGKVKEIALISPQGKIIENLCLKMQYKYGKESGKLKEKAGHELKRGVIRKTAALYPTVPVPSMVEIQASQRNVQRETPPPKELKVKTKSNQLLGGSNKDILSPVSASNNSLNKSLNSLAKSADSLGKKVGKLLNGGTDGTPIQHTEITRISQDEMHQQFATTIYTEGSSKPPNLNLAKSNLDSPTNGSLPSLKPKGDGATGANKSNTSLLGNKVISNDPAERGGSHARLTSEAKGAGEGALPSKLSTGEGGEGKVSTSQLLPMASVAASPPAGTPPSAGAGGRGGAGRKIMKKPGAGPGGGSTSQAEADILASFEGIGTGPGSGGRPTIEGTGGARPSNVSQFSNHVGGASGPAKKVSKFGKVNEGSSVALGGHSKQSSLAVPGGEVPLISRNSSLLQGNRISATSTPTPPRKAPSQNLGLRVSAMPAARKKSIAATGPGGATTITRRSDDVFGFDNGLEGVGPTELLDLRKPSHSNLRPPSSNNL